MLISLIILKFPLINGLIILKTIGSSICKLFTKILNIRLDKFCIKRQLIRNEQIGFSKGKRNSDHIFVLKTLIDKYCQQGSKRLFSCFVDFRSAFDTIRHEELFYINYPLVAEVIFFIM
jgi:hypothetical protein